MTELATETGDWALSWMYAEVMKLFFMESLLSNGMKM